MVSLELILMVLSKPKPSIMKFNNKKLEQTSKLVHFLIAGTLCIFLIALSNSIIGDMDDWTTRPTVESFKDEAKLEGYQSEILALGDSIRAKDEARYKVQNTFNLAKANHQNAKESFRNWLATRGTIGLPREDQEVLNRTAELDKFYEASKEWNQELSKINNKIKDLRANESSLHLAKQEEMNRANRELATAKRQYQLKVFFKRFLLVFPILLIGIFFLLKKREHKYWPLFLGFILFSFYAFFIGLVPYLLWFGAYIRYGMGAILSVLFGIYAINKIRDFIKKKKEELKQSSTDRAKSVKLEIAEKALEEHMCPSCGKDFITHQWNSLRPENNILDRLTHFCRYCGLELFKKCDHCDTQNFVHLPFCSNCGHSIKKLEE